LSNQFRSLEEDEIIFLDAVQEDKRSKERKLKDQETEELLKFREAVAARASVPSRPALAAAPPPAPTATAATAAASTSVKKSEPPKPKGGVIKKDQRSLLKGLVIAKKKPATKSGLEKTSIKDPKSSTTAIAPFVAEKGKKREATGDEATESKRVKTEETQTSLVA